MLQLWAINVAVIYVAVEGGCYWRLRRVLYTAFSNWDVWRQEENNRSLARPELLARLDFMLMSPGSYVFLQRMTTMAPLIGVIFTAFGFMTLGAGSSSSGPGATSLMEDPFGVLKTIRPLFFGVLLGAALALWNLMFLQVAHRAILRMRAKGTEHVDRDHRDPENEALNQFAQRIQFLTAALDTAMSAMTARTEDAVKQLGRSVERLTDGVGSLTVRWETGNAAMQAATEGFAGRFDEATQRLNQGVGDLLKSISATASAMERHVTHSHQTLEATTAGLRTAMTAFAPLAQETRDIVKSFSESSSAAIDSVRTWQTASQKQMVVAEALTEQLVQQTVPAIEALTARCRRISQTLDDSAKGLEDRIARAGAALDPLLSRHQSNSGRRRFWRNWFAKDPREENESAL